MLECDDFLVGQGVGLGDDGNQIHPRVESAHDFDVEGLQGVAGRLDEVDAGMDPIVNNVHAVDLVLGVEVGIVAELNVFHNWAPRIIVVDKVSKARGVNDGEAESHAILLNVGADGLDGNGLWDDIETGAFAFLWRVEGGVEEGVDKSRLAETGFT